MVHVRCGELAPTIFPCVEGIHVGLVIDIVEATHAFAQPDHDAEAQATEHGIAIDLKDGIRELATNRQGHQHAGLPLLIWGLSRRYPFQTFGLSQQMVNQLCDICIGHAVKHAGASDENS